MSLPRTYTARTFIFTYIIYVPGRLIQTVAYGRCAIEIDYQAIGDVVSWNEINNALAAVFAKV